MIVKSPENEAFPRPPPENLQKLDSKAGRPMSASKSQLSLVQDNIMFESVKKNRLVESPTAKLQRPGIGTILNSKRGHSKGKGKTESMHIPVIFVSNIVESEHLNPILPSRAELGEDKVQLSQSNFHQKPTTKPVRLSLIDKLGGKSSKNNENDKKDDDKHNKMIETQEDEISREDTPYGKTSFLLEGALQDKALVGNVSFAMKSLNESSIVNQHPEAQNFIDRKDSISFLKDL